VNSGKRARERDPAKRREPVAELGLMVIDVFASRASLGTTIGVWPRAQASAMVFGPPWHTITLDWSSKSRVHGPQETARLGRSAWPTSNPTGTKNRPACSGCCASH